MLPRARDPQNVRQSNYGQTELFATGPGLAGECLRRLKERGGGLNYTMELVMGEGGLYHVGGFMAMRAHAWETRRRPRNAKGWERLCKDAEQAGSSAVTLRTCKPKYKQLWQQHKVLARNCSV